MMKTVVLLLTLSVLAGCGGAGKAAMNAGKGFERFECASRNFKGETPCAQPDSPTP